MKTTLNLTAAGIGAELKSLGADSRPLFDLQESDRATAILDAAASKCAKRGNASETTKTT